VSLLVTVPCSVAVLGAGAPGSVGFGAAGGSVGLGAAGVGSAVFGSGFGAWASAGFAMNNTVNAAIVAASADRTVMDDIFIGGGTLSR
jgi:hypothetical protein